MARRSFEDEINDRSRREQRSRRRRRKPRPEEEIEEQEFENEEATPRKRRRWPFLLLLLLVALFLLPNAIGWLGLQQHAIDLALKDFNGSLSVEKVSMGWLQPIELTNVAAVDVNGSPLFQIEQVTSTKPLYNFVSSTFQNNGDYGQLDIVKPVANVQLRVDGSNLEDALSNYLVTDSENAPTTTETKPLPRIKLNLVDGMASVVALDTGQTWQLDQLNVIAEVSTDPAPLVINAQCLVTPVFIDDSGQGVLQAPGGFSLASQFDSGADLLTFNSADLVLQSQDLPMSLAAPVLRRVIGPVSANGNLTGTIETQFSSASNAIAVNAKQVSLTGFSLNAPDLIGRDTISIQNVTANGEVQISPTIISAKQFNLKSEVGRVNAEGDFDVNQLANLASNPDLPDTPFQMNGEVDLAQLIRMLPSTLQLHQDLVVNSGKVNFTADSRNENGNRRMVVNLDTANLNARRGNQRIVWAKPLRLVGTIQENSGQMSLEDVRCESDFLTVVGNANLRTGSFVATGDLDKLMDRIGQFVDLKGSRAAGVLNGKFGWQVDPNATAISETNASLPIQIGGSFVVNNPVIELAGIPKWQEKTLAIKLSGSGNSSADALQLSQGGIQLDVGNEQLIATLAEPVSNAYQQQAWKADCRATGSFGNWLAHVRNFVDIGSFDSDGNLTMTCRADLNSKQLQLSAIEYQVSELVFDGYGMKIRDPNVVGDGEVVYDFNTGNVLIPKTTLTSNSISAASQNLHITFPENMRVDGGVAFKADMNRIADWFQLSTAPNSVYWFGGMEGNVQFASNEHGIGGRLNATVTDLIAAQQVEVPIASPTNNQSGQAIQASGTQRQWQEIYREANVGLSGDVSLASDFNAIALQNVLFQSASLSATTHGVIADLGGEMVTDLQGTWNPNWENLNSLLAGYTGGLMKFSGKGEKQFIVKGPIFSTSTNTDAQPWVSPELQAVTSISWDSGEIASLGVGPSQIDVNVQQSVAFLQTSGIPFAGGVVKFAPQIDMRGSEPVALMDATRVIDNVELKPETARQWLKYVAPLVADATSAQGRFTVDIQNLQMPVFDPLKVQSQGAIHLSDVVVGAGPVADQLLGTVKQVRALLKPGSEDREMRTWLRMEQQSVPYLVRDGRVYHEKLKFSHKDLAVHTKGSVGLDQTINLTADIQIHDDWIAGKPYLAGLKGQSLSIPITGTVSKPVIDRNALQQLSANLARQAAGNAINNAIGEKINPKLQDYQNQFNNKVNEELGGFQNKIQEKLRGSIFPGSQNGTGAPGGAMNQAPTNPPAGQSIGEQIGNTLEDELKKGIGNLFGK